MPWTNPNPLETWSPRQIALLLREWWTRARFFSFSWSPGSIAPSTMVTYTLATAAGPGVDLVVPNVKGLRVGMGLKVTGPTAPPPGLVWEATAVASDTLTVTFQNVSGATVTPPPGTWNIIGTVT